MSLRVILLANYADLQGSMLRFANLLEAGLKEAGIECRTIRPKTRFGMLGCNRPFISKWLGYVDKFVLFPISLRHELRKAGLGRPGNLSIVHITDHGNALYTRFLRKIPHLVTCHDLLAVRSGLGEFNENRLSKSGRCLQRAILKGLQRSAHVVCDSKATRRDLLRLLPELKDRSDIIPVAMNYPFSPMPSDETEARLKGFLNIPERCGIDGFILHVGGNQWYKNRLGVLRIYQRFCKHNAGMIRLHMVGPYPTIAMSNYVKKHKLAEIVSFHTDVSDEDLRAFYTMAECLIFPSLYEGFGWPIVEAQACGCRVITTKRPPMTETGGRAAYYIDPAKSNRQTDLSDWAESGALELRRMIDVDEESKRTSIQHGLMHSREFNRSKMIGRYLEIYQVLAKGR